MRARGLIVCLFLALPLRAACVDDAFARIGDSAQLERLGFDRAESVFLARAQTAAQSLLACPGPAAKRQAADLADAIDAFIRAKCAVPRARHRAGLVLVDSEVHNVQGAQLSIDAAGRNAAWRHCCDGGKWDADFTWKVPDVIVPGEEARVEIGVRIYHLQPEQELSLGIVARALDFGKQLIVKYPAPGASSESYVIPTSIYKDAKEASITIEFVSSTVVYHYRRE